MIAVKTPSQRCDNCAVAMTRLICVGQDGAVFLDRFVCHRCGSKKTLDGKPVYRNVSDTP